MYFLKSNRLLNQGFHFLFIHTTIIIGHSANWKNQHQSFGSLSHTHGRNQLQQRETAHHPNENLKRASEHQFWKELAQINTSSFRRKTKRKYTFTNLIAN